MSDTMKTIIGVSFIFIMTTLGSALVFFFKKEMNKKVKQLFLGFASGVMIAATIWSLIIPSLETEIEGIASFIPAVVGILVGALFLYILDKVIPHFHPESEQEEGIKSNLNRASKMFLAVTLHNIPEGLAVGLSFGVALAAKDPLLVSGALGLAIGMGLQNFPEGTALAIPMKEETGSTMKGFLAGTASGIVEPIAALFGIFLASQLTSIMPWALSFAAGAMLYVVIDELIPEARTDEHSHFGTWGAMVGFIIMMVLDIALG